MNRKVFVLTGNTGTGKTTVANYLNEFFEMPKVITHTTRAPREGEVDQLITILKLKRVLNKIIT